MTEHPLLLNGDMSRALDAGKTQTRRPMKLTDKQTKAVDKQSRDDYRKYPQVLKYCPFGGPGDVLVPLTTWSVHADLDQFKPTELPVQEPIWSHWSSDEPAENGKHRPGMFLPLFLRDQLPRLPVKRVWVERVQDISEAEAIAEGIEVISELGREGSPLYRNYLCDVPDRSARYSFRTLWDSLYAAKGLGWADNPWVFACEFEREKNRG